MTSSRSYGDKTVGQQLYKVIEFCNSPEALWAKLHSGHYDWLGVKPDERTFVLGRPPIPRTFAGTPGVKTADLGADGTNRVEIKAPDSGDGGSSHVEPDDAETAFDEAVARLRTPDGSSGIYRVRLILNNKVERDEYIVRVESNYGQPRKSATDG